MVARSVGPSSQGETIFFAKYCWPVRWVPAVRWRNNYFLRNKEALPCGCRGPSCQPLHVQYSSDGSRSLTTLTTPRRQHHGGGRRRGLGRGRRGAGEDATVDAHAERSTRVHWFGCGVRLLLPQGLAHQGRWTTARPQSGTARRWRRRGSGVADGEEWET